ncbi:hypothetical protein FB567DRAFT_170781 [Paraphoma chrysanthemicola]|uniref:Uncharacterized protein n=1 Tax=Paraphoma chrysanthemicola TaxID=798071 RepID=A0A8K0RCX8_9PLEO|nr:hypothetical protein FB567DRAFT_170781 [Paraphoma chrysanthemicola]
MSTSKEATPMITQYNAESDVSSAQDERPPTSSREVQPMFFWFWETISMIASAACLMAVIIILAWMNSKPLDRWTIDISLNATIAIFITAAKSLALLVIGACIAQSKWIRFKTAPRKLTELDLFENAARGPLGSLMLLLQVRWHSGFASVGAILTILALGVDTFAQQVIRLDTRNVEVLDGGASFSISHNYTGGARFMQPHPVDVEPSTVDVAMEGAVLRGVYNISSNPEFKCNSMCVWHDSYISLGFTSQCKDVTTATLASNFNTTSNQTYNRGVFNLTTPGKVTLGMGLDLLWRTQINVNATGFKGAYDGGAKPQKPFPADFLRVAVARRHPDALVGFVSESDPPAVYFKELEITECTISFAAYNYTTLSASGNQLDVQSTIIPLDAGTVNGRPGSRVWYNQTGLPPFVVPEADITALVNLFESSRFSGSMTTGQVIPKPPSGIVMSLLKSDITKTFDNVAASMTEQLRSSGSDVARGISVKSVVFVHIRWGWLALPIAVTVVSAAFLVATWIHARLHHCVPWKSSSVAILYHHVVMNGDEKAVLRSEMRSLTEMERAAKKTKAALE